MTVDTNGSNPVPPRGWQGDGVCGGTTANLARVVFARVMGFPEPSINLRRVPVRSTSPVDAAGLPPVFSPSSHSDRFKTPSPGRRGGAWDLGCTWLSILDCSAPSDLDRFLESAVLLTNNNFWLGSIVNRGASTMITPETLAVQR